MGQALKSGEIDLAHGLDLGVYESLQGIPEITTVSSTPASFSEVAFNTGAALADGTPIGDGNELLKNKAVRQALSWAIDKQAIVDKVLGGQGLPGTTIIPPLYPQWHLDPANPFGYDPAKAGQLLDAAGFPVGDDGVRADADGNRLSFRLLYRTESEDSSSQKSSEFVQAYFKDIGVEVKLKGVTEDALYEIAGQGNFDMFEWGWGVEPDPNYMLSTFTCGNRSYEDGGSIYANLSDSFYCNAEYDKLFDEQSQETDFAKRQEIVKRMEQMLYDDAVYMITYYANGLEAFRNDRFTGWVKQPKDNGTLIYQWGTWSYFDVAPVSAAGAAESAAASAEPGASAAPTAAGDASAAAQPAAAAGGISSGLIIGLLVAVLVIVILVVLLLRMRRSATNEDRE